MLISVGGIVCDQRFADIDLCYMLRTCRRVLDSCKGVSVILWVKYSMIATDRNISAHVVRWYAGAPKRAITAFTAPPASTPPGAVFDCSDIAVSLWSQTSSSFTMSHHSCACS